jgi:hypothetical protein
MINCVLTVALFPGRFSDNYVIPLAEKLEECGVFGVSSDEYLISARANRQEWERKGEGIVKNHLESIQLKLDQRTKQNPTPVKDEDCDANEVILQ